MNLRRLRLPSQRRPLLLNLRPKGAPSHEGFDEPQKTLTTKDEPKPTLSIHRSGLGTSPQAPSALDPSLPPMTTAAYGNLEINIHPAYNHSTHILHLILETQD